MYHLILTLISISIFSSFLLATVNYVNPLKQVQVAMTEDVNKALYDWERAYEDYLTVNGTAPAALGDLSPEYLFLPPSIVEGAIWSYGTASGANYVCLRGTMNLTQLEAMRSSRNRHSAQAFFIHNVCGQTSNTAPDESSLPSTVAVTYWLSSY